MQIRSGPPEGGEGRREWETEKPTRRLEWEGDQSSRRLKRCTILSLCVARVIQAFVCFARVHAHTPPLLYTYVLQLSGRHELTQDSVHVPMNRMLVGTLCRCEHWCPASKPGYIYDVCMRVCLRCVCACARARVRV